jgi:hypothetical protein
VLSWSQIPPTPSFDWLLQWTLLLILVCSLHSEFADLWRPITWLVWHWLFDRLTWFAGIRMTTHGTHDDDDDDGINCWCSNQMTLTAGLFQVEG